jgi:predicted nucleic acid-binding Zn ribbon protein
VLDKTANFLCAGISSMASNDTVSVVHAQQRRRAAMMGAFAVLLLVATVVSAAATRGQRRRGELQEVAVTRETAVQRFAAQHPAYVRCAKTVDMPAFSHDVAVACGDIDQDGVCAEQCAESIRRYSSQFGCCWETVLRAYAHIDPDAGRAWRGWQGMVSSKCSVSFADHACKHASPRGVGESVYLHLRDEVQRLERQQAESRQVPARPSVPEKAPSCRNCYAAVTRLPSAL